MEFLKILKIMYLILNPKFDVFEVLPDSTPNIIVGLILKNPKKYYER